MMEERRAKVEDNKPLIKALFREYPLMKLGKLIDALNDATAATPDDKISLTFLANTLQELLTERVARKKKKKDNG